MQTIDPAIRLVAHAQGVNRKFLEAELADMRAELTRQRASAAAEAERRRGNLRIVIRITFIVVGVGLSIGLDASGIGHIVAVIIAASPDMCRECIERVKKL